MAGPYHAATGQLMKQLVLVGGGHSHLFVLEAAAQGKLPGVELTLVSPEARQVYSGMVPGYLEGRYDLDAISIDLPRIARRIGARFIEDGAKRVEAESRTLHLESGATVPFDAASIAIGGVPTGTTLPGVAHHATFLKPINRVLTLLPKIEETVRGAGPESLRVVVVGAGAAGVEVALTLRTRLDRLGATHSIITLIGASHTVLHDRSRKAAELAEKALDRREITRRMATGVEEIGADYVRVTGGKVLPADLILWTTGTDAPPLFRASGLPTDAKGFLLVDDTLAVQGIPGLFGGGDAVSLATAPKTPKAGVYAVRMGPFLAKNLAAYLAGTPLASYTPQDTFLALLNTGDGRAILSRGQLATSGRWAMRLKDKIDRGFMRRFQRLYA